MATQSSVLAWRIPGTGEPGGLPSMGSHATEATQQQQQQQQQLFQTDQKGFVVDLKLWMIFSVFLLVYVLNTFSLVLFQERKKKKPSSEFHGWRGLEGYGPWDCKESDTTEQLTLNLLQHGKSRKLGLCVSVQKKRGVVLA